MPSTESSVHAGNYYTHGVKRIIKKLAAMDVAVPPEALSLPKHEGHGTLLHEFSCLEHAVMDYFTDRDYDQAQALIHFRAPSHEWHVIYILDEDEDTGDITQGMICSSLVKAIEAVVFLCESSGNDVDGYFEDGSAVIVAMSGRPVLRIEPIIIEPFNLAIRDRVRSAFKGVRYLTQPDIMSGADKLPGFKSARADRDHQFGNQDVGMLLGFPGNWALAMRKALSQVGIDVKLNQAQELAAVFFGASNWHQLVKHQDELNSDASPVCVSVLRDGEWDHSFYCTPEEALFATGRAIENYPEAIAMEVPSVSLRQDRVLVFASTQREKDSCKSSEAYLTTCCIECGNNDYFDTYYGGTKASAEKAGEILASLWKLGNATAAPRS